MPRPFNCWKKNATRELVNKNLEADIKTIQTAWEEKIKEAKKKLIEKRIAAQPKDLQEDLRKLVETPPEKRDEVQRYLAQKFESSASGRLLGAEN